MRHHAIVLAVAAAVLTACGSGVQRSGSLADLGHCEATHVDGAPADTFVSHPGVWLRIRRIEVGSSDGERKTVSFAGDYEVVGGDAKARTALGTDRPASLTMHSSIARDADRALSLTPDVFAHLDIEATHVEFALAVAADDFAFLGDCQDRLLTAPLRTRFGDAAVTTVRGFVGKTGGEVAAAFPNASPDPSNVVILNPDTAPAEVLAGLSVARFSLTTLPDAWVGPYTVCTRIERGWSDCIDLSQRGTATIDADAYFDPGAPAMEVWLADQHADLAHPLALLATLDLKAMSAEADVPLADGVRIVATISETSSPETARRDPAQAKGSIGRVVLAR